MYDQFYNFNAEPFRLSPDHAFAYAHKGYVKARAYMAYAFMRAEGFVMITGRPGTGKTTLVGALVDHLAGEDVSVANLVCTQLQADDLLKLVAYEFGIGIDVVEKGHLLQQLTQQLKAWHRDGKRALLIVDEAQDLSVSAMEELRLLTNIQVDGKPLLQIFLLGQPELKELVLSPSLEQVHQRIVAASHLRALELDETEAYILHRLEVVGWSGDPTINKSVYPLIHKYSEGIPRRINLICSRLLLQCAVEQRHAVGMQDLREVIKELQEENLAAGSSFTEADFLVDDHPDTDPDPKPEKEESVKEQFVEVDEQADSAEQSTTARTDPGRAAPAEREGDPTAGGTTQAQKSPLVHSQPPDGSTSRQHLKVVGGGGMAGAANAEVACELDNVIQAADPEPVQVTEGELEQSEPEASSGRLEDRPVELFTAAPSAEPQARAAAVEPFSPGNTSAECGEAIQEEVLPKTGSNEVNRGGYGEIVVIFVISIGLVAWASWGFDLGTFLN
jgi:putative secretion ATPase (PEP-CTERM system associated)